MFINLVAGIDGLVPQGQLPDSGCCPPDICEISVESLACNIINILPNGPLWDKAKDAGIACHTNCAPDCSPTNPNSPSMADACGSLVAHATYSAKKLYMAIMGALWPSLREAQPHTAYDTMDEWLDRLGWVDCYNRYCRDPALGEMTPYEVIGECGIEPCPPVFGADLERIYKRGVINALWRMRHGMIFNLSAINFVLEPLYSELVLDPKYGTDPATPKCLVLRSTADFAPIVIKEPCPRTPETQLAASKMVQTYLSPGKGLCAGGPTRAYPMTLAAHCIVRSMLPTCCTICVELK
jgi:hypothetical protein